MITVEEIILMKYFKSDLIRNTICSETKNKLHHWNKLGCVTVLFIYIYLVTKVNQFPVNLLFYHISKYVHLKKRICAY